MEVDVEVAVHADLRKVTCSRHYSIHIFHCFQLVNATATRKRTTNFGENKIEFRGATTAPKEQKMCFFASNKVRKDLVSKETVVLRL